MASCQQQQCPEPHVRGQTVTVSCKAYPALSLGIDLQGNPKLLPTALTDPKQTWMKVKVEATETEINICGFVSMDPQYLGRALYAKGDELALTANKVDKIDKSMLNVLWTEKGAEQEFENILKATDISAIHESVLWTADEGGQGIKVMLRVRNNQDNQLWNTTPIIPPIK